MTTTPIPRAKSIRDIKKKWDSNHKYNTRQKMFSPDDNAYKQKDPFKLNPSILS